MNKNEFIELLKKDDLSKQEKLEGCNFFISNYPVRVRQVDPFNGITYIWTSLNITITDGSDESININWNKLKSRVKELEEFKI